MQQFDGTTIVSVRRGGQVAIGGDGQVSLGNTIIKATARKVRKLYNNTVLAGFAGGTADAFTLIELFEAKLQKHQGRLTVSAIELAKEWRTDRALRRLEAMLIVADKDNTLIITGNGDVLEPEGGIAAIGSGGAFAQAAARNRGEKSAGNRWQHLHLHQRPAHGGNAVTDCEIEKRLPENFMFSGSLYLALAACLIRFRPGGRYLEQSSILR